MDTQTYLVPKPLFGVKMHDSSINPKPTLYKGIIFRSLLETKWSTFFDKIGLDWKYEPETYILENNLYYKPDFWFPQLRMFGEVKPMKSEVTT